MKKLTSIIIAAAVMAVPFTAYASEVNNTTITDQTPAPKQANAVISASVSPKYTVTIPADTTVGFMETETDFGSVELTVAQLEPEYYVEVSLNSAGNMKNANDNTKVIPYTISAVQGTEEIDDAVGTALEFVSQGDKADLSINITEAAWNSAAAGSYSDSVTFTVAYKHDDRQ